MKKWWRHENFSKRSLTTILSLLFRILAFRFFSAAQLPMMYVSDNIPYSATTFSLIFTKKDISLR